MAFPTIDGHFWVVRDGKIIDPIFDEYKAICEMRGADWKQQLHIPAPEMTQTIMLGIFKKVLDKSFGENPFEKQIENFCNLTIEILGELKPRYQNCYKNCLLEINARGGDIVFGSMGFKYNDINEYWYEYGGKNWTTIKDFMK